MSDEEKSVAEIVIGANQDRPKRARRSRKDCDQRSFICKICLKTYLSNAALYTHVKNKHQLQKPKQLPNQKVGEAGQDKEKVANDGSHGSRSQAGADEQRENKQQNTDSNINSVALQGLRQVMKKYYPERNKNSSIKLICQGLPPQIAQYIEPLMRQAAQGKFSQVQKQKLTISQVFSIFLYTLNSKVSSSCINFLVRFFYYFRHALRQQSKKPDFCQKQNASLVPTYFNNVVLNKRIPISGYDQQQLMHSQEIICRILEHFGYWLYDEFYSNYKTKPNYQVNN